MVKPVILAVDDDPQVLRAVERDLKRKYAREYRVLRADSGESALDALGRLKLRGDPVALFLVDQRMPRMTGVEFLERAIEVFPEAKRDLLTAYADTDAAIRAINDVGLDYYLQKPWDPPEEHLYPILDDQLEEWHSGFNPPFEGIRVVGDRWSPDSHRLQRFPGPQQGPVQVAGRGGLRGGAPDRGPPDSGAPKLPVVVFQDGTHLEAPENREVAEKIGLRTRAERPFYDLIIIGGGPSGLAAAVYGASEGLKTVLIEREAPGGQAGTSSFIENYLGFPQGLKGSELARRAVDQAKRFEVEILTPQEVADVRVEDPYRIVRLGDGTELSCHALIIATGVSYRKLKAPGIDRLTGAGVYYGASLTEAHSCKNEDVYIVGGANSAGQAAMYFSEHARKVVVLYRGDSLRKSMSEYLVKQVESRENIEVRLNSAVVGVEGEDHLERIVVKDSASGESESVPAQSLFIFIGAAPHTDWLGERVVRDERGFILSGSDLSKNAERPKGWRLDRDPYPAGDQRPRHLRRRRRAPRLGKAVRLRRRRGLHRGPVRPPVPEGGLRWKGAAVDRHLAHGAALLGPARRQSRLDLRAGRRGPARARDHDRNRGRPARRIVRRTRRGDRVDARGRLGGRCSWRSSARVRSSPGSSSSSMPRIPLRAAPSPMYASSSWTYRRSGRCCVSSLRSCAPSSPPPSSAPSCTSRSPSSTPASSPWAPWPRAWPTSSTTRPPPSPGARRRRARPSGSRHRVP